MTRTVSLSNHTYAQGELVDMDVVCCGCPYVFQNGPDDFEQECCGNPLATGLATVNIGTRDKPHHVTGHLVPEHKNHN